MSLSLLKMNNIKRTDSYKISHWKQYPPMMTNMYSYFESRGGRWPESVFYGLQYYLMEYLSQPVTLKDMDAAQPWLKRHFMGYDVFNREGWAHVVNAHGGRLPLSIKAVPEGTVVPNKNILMSVQATDPRCRWLTNYIETMLVKVWYPCTVATQSRAMKRTWLEYLERTGTPSDVEFKLHDFGYRGSTSEESAAIGGSAHLLSFKGTDTLIALDFAEAYYGATEMPGFSIPAAEHSTIASWGRGFEAQAYKHILDQFHDAPLVAVVSDTYDIFNAVREIWGKQLRAEVLAFPGVVIARPDSGAPDEISVEVIRGLAEMLGATVNPKGYKVLNPHIRTIYGDKIDSDMQRIILDAVTEDGWSADNIAMGSGGGLLQKMDRDTLRYKFMSSAIEANGQWHGIRKEPVTDEGKWSRAGRFKLILTDKGFETVPEDSTIAQDQLVEVWRNGGLLQRWQWDDVRKRMQ